MQLLIDAFLCLIKVFPVMKFGELSIYLSQFCFRKMKFNFQEIELHENEIKLQENEIKLQENEIEYQGSEIQFRGKFNKALYIKNDRIIYLFA